MKRHDIFRGLTLVAIGLLILGVVLQAAAGMGLSVDKWFYWLALGLILGVAVGLLGIRLLLQLATDKKLKNKIVLKRLRSFLLSVFPLLYVLKPLLKEAFLTMEKDLVELNNQLILDLGYVFLPAEILIITPHCLQSSRCDIKVTRDIEACLDCGKCGIADLKTLKRTFGVNVIIATGGTLARKTILEHKPNLIIAVACERDLVSGIIDMKKLLTFGVLNQKPNGPCLDTAVQTQDIENALNHFLHTNHQ